MAILINIAIRALFFSLLIAATCSFSLTFPRRQFYLAAVDDEIRKGDQLLQNFLLKKEAKTKRKADAALARTSSSEKVKVVAPEVGKVYGPKTISGQEIVNCRSFATDGPKKFDFVGSYKSMKAAPIFSSPEIAFLGRSNVGKSSLLNSLTALNKKIAVESKTPGRTQSINLFKCSDKEGDICVFVDLPGYGFAKMSKQQQEEVSFFLRDYLSNRAPLRLAVLLIDIRREPQMSDAEMLKFLRDEGLPYVVVATKTDKMKADEVKRAAAMLRQQYNLPANMPLITSSVTGAGKRDVWGAIKAGIIGDTSVVASSIEDDDEEEELYGDVGYDGDGYGDGKEEDEEMMMSSRDIVDEYF